MITLTLTEGEDGVFTYESTSFFPIDNLGFGNEGNEHNFHFTTEAHLYFTYRGGEVLRFSGDDDLFVFMNGRLALDLGGVHASQTAEVSLDDIATTHDLQIGQNYPLDLFHAERHLVQSNFSLSTTIALKVMPGGNPVGPGSSNPSEYNDMMIDDYTSWDMMINDSTNDQFPPSSSISDQSMSIQEDMTSLNNSNDQSTQGNDLNPIDPTSASSNSSSELANFGPQDSGCQAQAISSLPPISFLLLMMLSLFFISNRNRI